MTTETQCVIETVIRLWSRSRLDWNYPLRKMGAALRADNSLSSAQRREVGEIVYGMIRNARRIEHVLQKPDRWPAGTARERARYAAYRLLTGDMTVAQAEELAPRRAFAWRSVLDASAAIEKMAPGWRRLALASSLPDWLAKSFCDEFGDDGARKLCDSLNQRAQLCVRANTLRVSPVELAARLADEGVATRPTEHASHGLVFDKRVNAYGLSAYKEGLCEVQDEGSQLVAELVAPEERSLIVDFCAGAGGKSLALAAALGSHGRVIATDVDRRMLGELQKRARRAGVSNLQAVPIEVDNWPDEIASIEGRADRVLVDAPCSGLGTLRREPQTRWRLAKKELAGFAQRQFEILQRASELVAPGGRLIYATCTLLAVENQAVVDRFARNNARFEPVPASRILNARQAKLCDKQGNLQLLPHVHGTDGFFASVFQRR